MSLPALYELTNELREAMAVLADIETDPQAIADTLEGLTGSFELKAVNVAKCARMLEATADEIRAAEAQMAARRKAYEASASRIRDYLKTNMEMAGITEIACPYFKLAIKRNPPSVVIKDAEQLPVEYVVLPPIPPPSPDKRKISDALKAGKDVPGASLDATKTRLEIK